MIIFGTTDTSSRLTCCLAKLTTKLLFSQLCNYSILFRQRGHGVMDQEVAGNNNKVNSMGSTASSVRMLYFG